MYSIRMRLKRKGHNPVFLARVVVVFALAVLPPVDGVGLEVGGGETLKLSYRYLVGGAPHPGHLFHTGVTGRAKRGALGTGGCP